MRVICINTQFSTQEKPDGFLHVTNDSQCLSIRIGQVYEVLSIEHDWFRIIDASGEDYLYPQELFKALE